MSKQAIERVIGEFMGIIEVLLQSPHILVASDFNDLVHRLSGCDCRGDKSAPQAVAADVEIIDGLTGEPLDHQGYPLWSQGIWHELPPAVHPPKQRPLADPAFA